ncbi:MAG: TonB-dependent receptor [Xanthomonadaceae bacterium]|nr:TonB-dependent receptor [Xanthomonadaceae bacterium]
MSRIHQCVAICAALLTPTAAPAEAIDSEQTVVVTATRTPLAIDDALAPVIVITAEDLRRTATFDIAEALRVYAGIEIGRNGGPGQATSLFIRGTNSNHAQVLVDGVRVNPGTLGGAALQNIRPQDIERIEVVKGPRSSLYGTEAIGGVVNIITRRARRPFHADAEAGAGRYGTRTAGAGIAGRQGAWYAGLRGDYLTTDGFPPQSGATVDRGHENTTLGAHAGWENAGHRLALRHREARGNTEYLDFLGTPVDQDFTNAVSALEYAAPLGDAVRSTLRLARAVDEIHQQQSPDYAETRRTSIDWQVDWTPTAAHAFNLGLYQARENTRAEVFGGAFDERPETRAAFVQYQRHGARTQQLVAARHSDHDAFGGHMTWNAEHAWLIGDDWRLVAGAGTAFRAPDSTQRFGFGGDPALRPEQSRNIELGLRGRLGEHRRIEWQVYENRIDDLIAFDLATFTLANIDRARIRGTELAFTHARDRWYWRQSFVLQRPEDLGTGDPLPRRARRSMQTALRYDAGAVHFGGELIATGPRKDSGFSDDYIGGYVLVNLSAQWALTPRWTLDARLENALDKRYETALGFPMAGRSLFVRARWQH